MINRSFWKGKKVFLTGHSGFKGSWMSLWLNHLGADVYGYALEPESSPSLFKVTSLPSHIKSTIGDIRDFETLKSHVEKFQPEIIMHLAAQPLVRKSYRDPIETYSTNVMGTVNILEAAKTAKNLRAIINVTTDKVYENKEWAWPYREVDRLGGFDPYSNSKACSELVTASFRSSFFNKSDFGKKHNVSVVTARAGNVIGGGDWAEDRLIPDIIRAYEKKQTVEIRNPNAIRPWQHVLESVAGYLKLAEHLYTQNSDYQESWNFGPGASDFMTVGDIVNYIQKNIPEMNLQFQLNKSDLHEAQILKLDNSLASSRLGWKSNWKYSQAIEQTLQWYLNYFQGHDPLKFTLKQIEQFEQSL